MIMIILLFCNKWWLHFIRCWLGLLYCWQFYRLFSSSSPSVSQRSPAMPPAAWNQRWESQHLYIFWLCVLKILIRSSPFLLSFFEVSVCYQSERQLHGHWLCLRTGNRVLPLARQLINMKWHFQQFLFHLFCYGQFSIDLITAYNFWLADWLTGFEWPHMQC